MESAEMASNKDAIIVRYQKTLCVCGYHIYKAIWEAATCEILAHVAEL